MSTENHEYEIDGEVISSKNGAEIFNDYQHNIASGDYSHAEGSETIASGPYSHAEGGGTIASGAQSHSEGGSTKATADNSHAEGQSTISASPNQHVQGKYNVEDTESKYAFIIGNGTSNDNRSNAIAIDWDGNILCYGDEISINEQIDNNTRKLSGIDDNANNYIHPTHTSHSKSMYKFANDELGHVSDAEEVTKQDIVDLGIPGQDTTYTGGNTDFGTITVDNNTIKISDAVGISTAGKTYTIDDAEVTAGTGAEIFNSYDNNIAFGHYSHAEGASTTASGDYSHAEGLGTTASGRDSHAEGYFTTASGQYSHAEGHHTTASGCDSHAEGHHTTASRDYSHAEGASTTASGDYSHAEGASTTASGRDSHAEGYFTTASGQYSHAEGYFTTASGQYSHAEGYFTTAASEIQHVQGKYNIKDTENKYAFIIGNGTNNNDRSNAIAIDWDGNIFCDGDETSLNAQIDANTKKLSGIDANANNYVHPTTSGNKHIPSGGSSGQILRWLEDGTAVWGEENDTEIESISNIDLENMLK